MKTVSQVDSLNLVIERVVRVLADKSVKVTRTGNKAFVSYSEKDGSIDHVNIPSLPENAPSDLITAIKGFVDHEVAHLLFSDFAYSAKRIKSEAIFKNKIVAGMVNALEDCWIEGAMRERFGGSEHNLEDTRIFMIDNFFEPQFKQRLSSGDLLNPMFAFAFFFTPMVRALYGQSSMIKWCEDKWEMIGEKNAKILKSFESKIRAQRSSKDSFDLAKEILDALDAKVPEDESEPNESESQSGDGKKSQDKNSKGKDSKKDQNKKSDKNENDESDEDGDSESDEDGDEDGDGDEDEDGDEDGDGDEDSDGDGKGSTGLSAEGGSSTDAETDGGEDNSDSGEGDGEDSSSEKTKGEQSGVGGASFINDPKMEGALNTTDSALAKMVEDLYNNSVSSEDYIPYTTDFDILGPYIPHPSQKSNASRHIRELIDGAESGSGVIRQEIVRAFTARSQSRWQPGLRKGKINPASIYKVSSGDDRVFRQREISKTTDIAVTLLIDCSGSMSGEKIENAMKAALMMSNVFTQVKIKHEILGFSTAHDALCVRHGKSGFDAVYRTENFDRCQRTGKSVSRLHPLATYVFKPFDKHFTREMKEDMSAIAYSYDLQGNTDHENLLIAAKRLLAQKVTRRIIIVMSDGQPVSSGLASGHQVKQMLHKTIADVREAGIELLGIGLEDYSVQTFYGKDSKVVTEAEGIPEAILGTIRSLIQ